MSYWGSEGKYQSQSDQIAQDIPAEGHAQNVAVELYRCAQNVYYEIYNNGGGNMGCDAYQNNDHEFSKNTQLRHIASYGIDTSKLEDLVEKMVEEYETEREHDYYDDSESEEMVKELWKDGGFMDQMMNSVIEKCAELGYEFKEDLED
jgi:tRNA A37 threonylcarbamoyladenosine modification protein TsaB